MVRPVKRWWRCRRAGHPIEYMDVVAKAEGERGCAVIAKHRCACGRNWSVTVGMDAQ